jgi:hypothetical protein
MRRSLRRRSRGTRCGRRCSDGCRYDPSFRVAVVAIIISLITLAAVLFRIRLAKRTLHATKDESKLSNTQLAEAPETSEQTRQARRSCNSRSNSRARTRSAIRRAAPRVVAEIRDKTFENVPRRSLVVINKRGGTASYVTISALTPKDGGLEFHPAAGTLAQALAAIEERYTKIGLPYPTGSYAQKIRIRYLDAFREQVHYRVPFHERRPWSSRRFGNHGSGSSSDSRGRESARSASRGMSNTANAILASSTSPSTGRRRLRSKAPSSRPSSSCSRVKEAAMMYGDCEMRGPGGLHCEKDTKIVRQRRSVVLSFCRLTRYRRVGLRFATNGVV